MNPGSPDAIHAGCRCNGPQNQWGRGLPGSEVAAPMYEVDPRCVLHRAGWMAQPVEDGNGGRHPMRPRGSSRAVPLGGR